MVSMKKAGLFRTVRRDGGKMHLQCGVVGSLPPNLPKKLRHFVRMRINTTHANTTRVISAPQSECAIWIVHDFVFDAWHKDPPSSFFMILSPWGLLALSLVLCLSGYYAMRAVLFISAFLIGAVGVARLSLGDGEHRVSCDAITVVTILVGSLCGMVVSLLLKTMSLIVGAMSMCGVTGGVFHVCGNACLGELWPGTPVLLSFPLVPFWSAMAFSAGGGAFVANKYYRELVAVVSAIIGGFGAAASLRTISLEVSSSKQEMSSSVFVVLMMVFAVAGLTIQYKIWKHTQRAKQAKVGENKVEH